MSISLRAKLRAKNPATNIAEALEAALPREFRGRRQRLAEHVRQRLDPQAVRRALVQRVSPAEHGQQIDHVLFGRLVDVEMLFRARSVKGITEEFLEGAHRNQRSRRHLTHAWHPFCGYKDPIDNSLLK
jgi:hypothetical protein